MWSQFVLIENVWLCSKQFKQILKLHKNSLLSLSLRWESSTTTKLNLLQFYLVLKNQKNLLQRIVSLEDFLIWKFPTPLLSTISKTYYLKIKLDYQLDNRINVRLF